MADERIRQELNRIAKKHKGVLNPHDVVEFARDESTALHGKFDWDDGEAAEKWRVHQARMLLCVYVTVLDDGPKEPVRAWVSLKPDRISGGGYRSMAKVLSSEDLRAELLRTAMQELAAFEKKYSSLKELAGVFDAIHNVQTPPRQKVAV